MLKLALCLCFLARLVHGQIDGYLEVDIFSCAEPTTDNIPQIIIKTEESGNVSSPCYDGNRTDYTKELDAGLRIANITHDRAELYGYQLTIEDFQLAENDRLYIGSSIIDAGRNSEVLRAFILASNSTTDDNIYIRSIEDGPIEQVLNWKDSTNNKLQLEASAGFSSVFLDFYTIATTAGGRGFLIKFVVDINRCEFTGDDVWCKNDGNCTRTGVNTASCDCTDFWVGERCTIDVDECADETDNCHEPTNATCINKDGGFDCKCQIGYKGNGLNCTDFDQCVVGNDCDDSSRARCIGIDRSFSCECLDRYIGDGKNCSEHIVLDNLNVIKTVNSLEISFDVTARWSGPEYISMFTLSLISLPDGTFEREFDFNSTDLVGKSFTFTGLRSFTQYNLTIRVRETGALFGDSIVKNDVATQIVTTAEATASVPRNFRLSDTQRGRITLSWDKPIEFGSGSTDGFGEVLHYQVCYSPSTDGEKIANIRGISMDDECLILDDTYTSITMTTIYSYVDLAFKIRAYSSNGYGDFTTVETSFSGTLCPEWVGGTRADCDGTDELLLQSEGFPRDITSSDNEVIEQYWSFDHSPVRAWRINVYYFDLQDQESSLDYGYGELDITDHDIERDNIVNTFTGVLNGRQGPFTKDTRNPIEDSLWFVFISDRTRKRPGFQVEIEPDGNSCDSSPCLHGGSCTDGTFSYACDCTSTDWTGPNCEYPHIRPSATCTTGKRNVDVNFQVQDEWKHDETVIGGYIIGINNTDGDSESKMIDDTTAEFTGLNPFRTYQVIVTVVQPDAKSLRGNVVWETRSIFCQTEEDVPSQPQNVVVTPQSRGFFVTWGQPAQPNGIVTYTVIFRSVDHASYNESANDVESAEQRTTSYSTFGLRYYRIYDVIVTAKTSVGINATETLTMRTLQGVPSQPQNVVVTPQSNGFDVTWDPPAQPNGIVSYAVTYKSVDHATYGETAIEVESAEQNTTSFSIPGLRAYRIYDVVVKAITAAGFADASTVTHRTLPGAPSPFVSPAKVTVIPGKSARVEWIFADAATYVGPVTVAVSAVTDTPGLDPVTSTSALDGLNLTLVGLEDGQTYNFTLTASTGTAPNQTILVTDVNTDSIAPGLVQSFDYDRDTSTFSWTPPALVDRNGNITGYRLTAVSIVPGFTTQEFGDSVFSLQLPGLPPFTSYTFEIQAINSAGEGLETKLAILTKEEVPSTPSNLQIGLVNTERITISWEGEDPPVGNTTYTVTYMDDATTDSFEIIDTTAIIAGLTVFTTYNITVIAKTNAGSSSPTADLTVQTAEGTPEKVQNLSAQFVSADYEIKVTWEAPAFLNGNLDVYIIVWTAGTTDLSDTSSAVEYTIRNVILSETDYVIEVYATTGGGDGPSDTFTIQTPELLPEVPQNVLVSVGSTEVTVNIDAPVSPIIPTNYIITISQDNDDCIKYEDENCISNDQTNQPTPLEIPYTITGLQSYRKYILSVVARAAGGDSAASGNVTFQTLPGTPIAVTNISTSTLPGEVNVTFVPGKPFTGPASYTILLTDRNGNTVTETVPVSERLTAITVTVTAVNPNTIYTVEVESTVDGQTTFSPAASSVTTRPGTPSFNITPSSSTQLDINVTPVDRATSYVISIQEVGCTINCSTVVLTTNGTTKFISGLRPYTTYDVSIFAVSVAGEGAVSQQQGRTKAGTPTLIDPSYQVALSSTTGTDVQSSRNVVLENLCANKTVVFDETEGPIISIVYIVIQDGTTESFEITRFHGQVYDEEPSPPYEAFTVLCVSSRKRRKREVTSDDKVVIGADNTCPAGGTTECNGPLKPRTTYTFRACGVNEEGNRACTEPSDPITTDLDPLTMECFNAGRNCTFNANCVDIAGNFSCVCKPGYFGDGLTCTDDDECTPGPPGIENDCAPSNSMCENLPGIFKCSCDEGYTGDGKTCSNVDECEVTGSCHVDADCEDIDGSFTCTCRDGYTGDGKDCVDLVECDDPDLNNCTAPASTCDNEIGSYRCICNSPAYRGPADTVCEYYCDHDTDCRTDYATGFLEMPRVWDGSSEYNFFEETFWNFFRNGSNGLRLRFLEFDTEIKDDFLSIYPGDDLDTDSEIVGISGGIGNLYNVVDRLTTTGNIENPGSTVTAHLNISTNVPVLTLSSSDLLFAFTSDRRNISTGFRLEWEYDDDNCPSPNPCFNGGTCDDRAFTYQCVGCPGYTGMNCDIDINECTDAMYPHDCDKNAACDNNEGSFTCACNADYIGNGKTCYPYIVLDNLNVVKTVSSLEISFDVTPRWSGPEYISMFTLSISSLPDGTFEREFDFNSTDLVGKSFTFTGLNTFTRYNLTIVIKETGALFGTSIIQNDVITQIITTAEPVPNTPTNVAILVVNSRDVTISWDAQEPSIGNIVYTISYSGGGTSGSFDILSTTATISDLTPFTTYTITLIASTNGGSSSPTANLTVQTAQDKSEAVQNLTAQFSYVNYEIVVTWDAPAVTNGVLGEYSIAWSTSGTRARSASSTTEFTIPNVITSGTDYEIEVYATTGGGDGPPTTIAITTPQLVPETPQNVVLIVGNTSVTININPPSTPVIPTNYIIDISQNSTECIEYGDKNCLLNDRTNQPTPSEIPFTITDLKNYREYELFVIAIAPGGESSKSDTVTFRTVEGIPSTPTDITVGVLNSQDITISWEGEDPQVGNTIYTVRYSDGATNDSFDTSSTTATITGLTPFTTYNISVTASTNAGSSSPSAELVAQTAEEEPEVVQNLNALFNIDNYEIVVTWDAPAVTNGMLGDYSITWTVEGSSSNDTSSTTDFTIPNVILSETDYLIEVYATTGGGEGPSSTAIVATPQLLPEVPQNIVVTAGSTSALVNIDPPTLPIIPTNYIFIMSQDNNDCILYGDVNCVANETYQPSPEEIPVNITGLKSYRTYQLSVIANAPGGESSASDIVTFQTLPGTPNPVTNISTSTLPGEVTVTFSPGKPFTGPASYTVILTDSDGNTITETVAETNVLTTMTATVAGVNPNTEYIVKVESTVNGETVSTPDSAASLVLTRPETPSFNITRFSFDQFDVEITEVDGALLYVLNYIETNCDTGCVPNVTQVNSTDAITITELMSNTTYSISIYAVSAAGESSTNTKEAKTILPIPNPPTNVQTKFLFDSVIVSFIPGKPFVGPASYLVTLTDEEGNTFTQTIDETSELSNISISITGIDPDATYRVQIEARFAGKTDGAILILPSPVTKPESPTFEITRFGTDQLNVDITAVDGATSYVLSYAEVNCDTDCAVNEVKVDNTETIPLTGLKPYTTYNISVYVVSASGESIATTKTERTKAGTPTLKDPDFKPIEATTTDTDIPRESSVVLENHCVDKEDIFDEGNGAVTSVSYIAIEDGTTESYEVIRYYGQVFNLDPSPPYQAFTASCSNITKRRKRELTSDEKIVIGADTSCTAESTTECNGPLKPGTTYTFRACGNTEDGSRNCTQPSDPITTDSASPQGLNEREIAAIVICTILLLVIIAVIIVCVIRRRRKQQNFP